MVKAGTDKIADAGGVRLPNAVKGTKMTLSIDPNSSTQQMIASPTSLMSQTGSPRLSSFNTHED